MFLSPWASTENMISRCASRLKAARNSQMLKFRLISLVFASDLVGCFYPSCSSRHIIVTFGKGWSSAWWCCQFVSFFQQNCSACGRNSGNALRLVGTLLGGNNRAPAPRIFTTAPIFLGLFSDWDNYFPTVLAFPPILPKWIWGWLVALTKSILPVDCKTKQSQCICSRLMNSHLESLRTFSCKLSNKTLQLYFPHFPSHISNHLEFH